MPEQESATDYYLDRLSLGLGLGLSTGEREGERKGKESKGTGISIKTITTCRWEQIRRVTGGLANTYLIKPFFSPAYNV